MTVTGNSTVRIPTYPPMDWRRAACGRAGMNPTWWDATPGTDLADQAIRICTHCPIRDGCLAWAKRTRQPTGIWGGRAFDSTRQPKGATA